MIRLYRIPLSTNVERVALAMAHKGLEVESVVVDPADARPVERASGQSQPLGEEHPRLEAWIRRMDERPRV